MPVKIPIENAPDGAARKRVVTMGKTMPPVRGVTAKTALARVRRLKLSTPAESAPMLRADRGR
jgi:hypothetical protein